MISPEPGIHRPSYNGAPAIQTLNINELDYRLRLRTNHVHAIVLRSNVRRCELRVARNA